MVSSSGGLVARRLICWLAGCLICWLPGEGGMGGGASRIGGFEEFDDTYLEFGLGMRFYDRFLQILRPENLPA